MSQLDMFPAQRPRAVDLIHAPSASPIGARAVYRGGKTFTTVRYDDGSVRTKVDVAPRLKK